MQSKAELSRFTVARSSDKRISKREVTVGTERMQHPAGERLSILKVWGVVQDGG